MKKAKVLLVALCAVLLVAASVAGTLAYLTSQETVVNTFTVGKVDIDLNETKVTPDGVPVPGADRVQENTYHLIPGMTYTKDPRITVRSDSEESYVRMLLTVDHLQELDAAFAPSGADLASIFVRENDTGNWEYVATVRDETANTVTYEFRYKQTVKPVEGEDLVLEPLFDSLVVPTFLSGEDMVAMNEMKITVVGHAIQAAGFANTDAAWAAFDDQMNG